MHVINVPGHRSFLRYSLVRVRQWWHVDKISPIKLYDENKIIAGFHLRELLFKQQQYDYVRRLVGTLFDLYTAGKIRPQIDSVWAFDDVSSTEIEKIAIQGKNPNGK